MNILIYASNSRYSNRCVGGAETSLELIAGKMAQLGEKVCFATAADPAIPSLPLRQKADIFVEETNALLDICQFPPVHWPCHTLLFPGLRQRFITARDAASLARVLETKKIDVTYSYEIQDTLEILKAKERLGLNVKIVNRVAGLFWAQRIKTRRLTKAQAEWVFNSVDAVNFLTPQSRELVYLTAGKLGLKLAIKKEFVFDIGIDLNLFPFAWQPRTRTPFRIVSVLRFAFHQKRPDLLIRALSHAKHRDIALDLIGVGADLHACQKLCRQLDLANRVTFHGYLSRPQIAKVLCEADLFALPSLYEGMPKAMLEAMAVGVPCLVSDVAPLNDFLRDGENGFLVPNAPDLWAKKIISLSSRRQALANVSQKARAFVVENYDADKNILKYQKGFTEMVRG